MTDPKPNQLRRTRPRAKTGIVHLGLGAFFRAHAAIYINEAMAGSTRDWGVVGVSLRSESVRDRLAPQDCLYTAVDVSAGGLKPQIIDVVNDVLVGPKDCEKILQTMSDPDVKIVSMTVTEKGYCRGSGKDALDSNHPDIAHDIDNIHPRSAPGFVVRALDRRRRNWLRPFTVLSLDNLPSNGQLTRQIVLALANLIDPDLAEWIADECRFPCTMVDRIVPATTSELIARVAVQTGIHDPATVAHEPFRQWVIEDTFVDGARPAFETTDAQLVRDVEPFENMKLRMLNGTHSALAYVGCLAGRDCVSDAIGDAGIEAFIDALWNRELAPSLQAPPGVDLTHYAQSLKTRYKNPEIKHQLVQIAMDGSQKLPQRVLDPLFENLAAGRPHARLLTVVAAWLKFLQSASSTRINDPLAGDLVAAIQGSSDNASLVANLLDISPVFGTYPAQDIAAQLVTILDAIDGGGIHSALKGI